MLILLKQTFSSAGIKSRLFWNTITKATETDTIAAIDNYVRGSGTLTGLYLTIDAYQVGSDIIRILWRNDLTAPVLQTISNAKILSFLNFGTTSKELVYFNTTSKTTESAAMQHGDAGIILFTAAANTYIRSTTDTLVTQCVGVNEVSWLSNGAGGVSKSINYNSATCGFVVATAGTIVTESIIIKLDNECKDNPIYLRWINTLGGYDYFMFHFTNEIVFHTKSRGQFEKTYTSLAEKTASFSRGKKAIKTIIVGAEGLSQNDYDGIYPDLFLSPSIYIVTAAGLETPVQITDGSWSMNSRDKVHSLEFELELPEYFTITQ